MSRQARERSSSGVYHVMMRAVGEGSLFSDVEDRERFIETLIRFKYLCGFLIYGYCLMSNHLHLLIKEQTETISQIIKRIGVSYAHWYNGKYDRSGYLFQGRFRSEAVEDDRYLLVVLRYIHQNPVKAGVVKEVSTYRWSSYADYLSPRPQLTDTEFVLDILHPRREEAVRSFEQFMAAESKEKCLEYEDYRQKRFSDEEVRQLIKKEIKADDVLLIQGMSRGVRNRILGQLKENGIPARQLSRVTGLSRNTVARA